MLRIIFFVNTLFLAGCFSSVQAPVEELRPQYSRYQTERFHTVTAGDTLYSIAFLHDQNTVELARINHLVPPYILKVGQRLWLSSSSVGQGYARQAKPVYRKLSSKWYWPARGQLFKSNWQNQIAQKGINIKGQYNQGIYAAQSGIVAYAGSGLPGYGNLILIMHPDHLISAYAYNAKILVREGQKVYRGQVIAKMGYMDKSIAALHFEIRHRGQAQNPLNYLP
jgi:lipoprotein NlpD